jgi:glutathione S-transferase
MSLVFYSAPMSTAGITELVLAELGIPYQRVRVDLKKGDTKKPEFLRLNPNAKVPLIVHEGTPVFESAAITLYLGETFGVEKGLYPAPGPRRGEAMKWVVWTNVSLIESVGRWARNALGWAPPEQQNAKEGEAGKAALTANLRILDQALEGKQYLAGDFTLADSHLSSTIEWLGYLGVDFAPHPHLRAWSERCNARPAHGKAAAAESA